MRLLFSRLESTVCRAPQRIASLALPLLSSGAFAHTGIDGGSHHELLNMAEHLTDLQAWLATLNISPWTLLPLCALGVWLAARWAPRKTKRKPRTDQREDQP